MPLQPLLTLLAPLRENVLREDVAMRKAVELVAEHAKPIEPERAAAREKLWTPSGGS